MGRILLFSLISLSFLYKKIYSRGGSVSYPGGGRGVKVVKKEDFKLTHILVSLGWSLCRGCGIHQEWCQQDQGQAQGQGEEGGCHPGKANSFKRPPLRPVARSMLRRIAAAINNNGYPTKYWGLLMAPRLIFSYCINCLVIKLEHSRS